MNGTLGFIPDAAETNIHKYINKNERERKRPDGSRKVHAYYPSSVPNSYLKVGATQERDGTREAGM